MVKKAGAEVTITDETDIECLVTWYQLSSSAVLPSKPTTTSSSVTPSGWTTTEPTFDPANGTRYLYTVVQTRWKDGTCTWDAPVQLSSAYEQAKQAWNKANAAKEAADAATEAAANAVVVKSAEGERSFVTEDAAELPLRFLDPVYGECVQDGTPTPDAPVYIQAVRGRNLVSVSDKSGTQTAYWWGFSLHYKIAPGTYTLSFTGESSTGVRQTTPGLSNNDTDNAAYSYDLSIVASGDIGNRKWVTFTVTQANINSYGAYISVRFARQSSTTTITATVSDVQLEYGSVLHDYVPYGSLGIIARGKNLLRLPSWAEISTCGKTSSYFNYKLLLEPNTTYHINTVWTDVALAKQCGYILVANDVGNTNWKAIAHASSGYSNANISTGSNGVLYFNVYATQAQYESMLANAKPQLEKGTAATAYEPYRESVTYLDLKGHELYGLDETYRDILRIDESGHAVIAKRCGKTTIGEAKNHRQYNTNNDYVITVPDMVQQQNIAYRVPLLGDTFKQHPSSDVWSVSAQWYMTGHQAESVPTWNRSIFFDIGTNTLTGSEFKSTYGDGIVIYPLDPEYWHTIDLGYVDLPTVSDGSTVHVAAEIQPVIGGEWWTKAGYSIGKLAQQSKESQGALEPPYTELEWVESDGTQYVYLDWKPPIATWGFEADFVIRNAFNTTVGAWRSDTNKNGFGNVFGTRNASSVNDLQLSTYGTTGTLRNGTGSYTTSGLFKTDQTRQQISYKGTSLIRGDGSTVTWARTSESANKPYANMVVFAMHEGVRRSGAGNLGQPGTVRLYSLKFYDGNELKVDLVGAIRNRDGMTGLYDKIKGHFYPAAGMSCGNAVGSLGEPDTTVQALGKADLKVYVDNRTVSRMWRAEVPTLEKLEDGQKLTVSFATNVGGTTPNDVAATGIDDFAGQWDEAVATSYSSVYLKLVLADGGETEWIPCYYAQGTRLTSHYGSGIPVLLTYRENVLYGQTTTSAGTAVMRAWYADPNYNTDDVYTRYSDTVIAGLNGVKRYSLNMRDANGNWTSIMNQANNTAATGKTAYTGGLMLGNVLYHDSSSDIAAGGNTGRMKESHGGVDFRYDVNGVQNAAATELQLRKPVYLVGTIDASSGLFYLDTTKWWTQNPVDPNKVYVQLGTAYSSYYAIFLSVENPTLVYDDDTEKLIPLNLTVTTFSNKYNTLVDTVDEHTTKVGRFEAQINGHYATSTTAAGTAAKTATIDPATTEWTPYKGATIAVKFQNANTAASPTLNVNGKGAVTILSYKGEALSEAEYKWEAGALKAFVYNGTNWLMQDDGAMKRLSSAETSISQKADSVTVTAIRTDLDNLEVGARNLYLQTKEHSGSAWHIGTGWTKDSSTYNGFVVLKKSGQWGGSWQNFVGYDALEIGDTFTISFWAKVDAGAVLSSVHRNVAIGNVTTGLSLKKIYPNNANDGNFLNGSNGAIDWTRCYATLEVTQANAALNWRIEKSNTGGDSTGFVYLCGFKLEKGNRATDWSPAPEDVEGYTDAAVTAAKAEVKVTTDNITSEVSKVSSIKYLESSTASWTLANLKTYTAEGHSENWNVKSTTPTTNLRVGDTVYVKGTDSTRNCTVYVKTTVTAINSTTQFTGTSHGYEDVLPVDTIKSTINQSADSVKIEARHVEIEGAAIFTSGRLSQTSLNNAYDAKGAASTALQDAKDYTDAQEFGGTNLLRKTPRRYTADAYDAYALSFDDALEIDQVYTVQLWDVTVSHTGKTAGSNLGIWVYIGGGNCDSGLHWSGSDFSTGHADHLVGTFTYTQARHNASGGTNKWLVLYNSVPNATGTKSMTVGKWKMEKGNRPTDWSPCPEDLQSEIDSKADVSDSVEYIVGTQTAATGSWTGVTKESSLVVGKTIAYKLPYAGSGNASLQLKDSSGNNVGGNIPVYSMTTRVTTHYPAGSIIQMTYDGTNWRTAGWYNTNNYDRTLHNNYVKAVANIAQYKLCCGTASGYREIAASVAFDLSCPVLYLNAANVSGQTYAVAANGQTAAMYEVFPGINPATTATVQSIAVNKTVFLKGTILGNTFTIAASNFLTCADPEEGYFYMPLGIVANDATTKMFFTSSKDLYAYLDGRFRQVTPTEIVASQRIYYRSSSSSKPTGNGLPTAWVTKDEDSWAANNTTVSNWTKKVSPLTSDGQTGANKYLYLWTCEQRKRLDGTVAYTDILLDDSTTIIDGGNIITNSIEANKLTVYDANIQKISASAIDVSGIRIGDLSGSIGGRNLFSWPTQGAKWRDEEHTLNDYNNVGGFTPFTGSLLFDPSQTVGEEYTISFWAKSPNGTTSLLLYNQNGSPKYFYFPSTTLTSSLGNEWTYFKRTVTNTEFTGSSPSTNESLWRRIEIYAPHQKGVLVKKIQVEKGNVATDWEPASEDMEAYADAAADAVPRMAKINTGQRNFTTAQWKGFGAYDHVESWTTGGTYDNTHLRVGDTAYLTGTVSDGVGGSATIIGRVTAVNGTASVTMVSTQLIFGGDSVDAARKTASNYITDINGGGISVHTPDANDQSKFVMNADSLAAYDDDNAMYFHVSAEGLSYGIGDDQNAVATTDDLVNVTTQFDTTAGNISTLVQSLIGEPPDENGQGGSGLLNSTIFKQDGDGFTFSLDTEIARIDGDITHITDYVNIQGSVMTLGGSGHPVCAQLSESGLIFYRVAEEDGIRQIDYGNPIASLVVEGAGENAQGVLVIHRAVVVNELRLDNWAWTPRGNRNLALKWIGE